MTSNPRIASQRPLSPLAAVLWTFAAMAALNTAVAITDAARPGAHTDLVNVTACELLAFMLVLFFMLRRYAPRTPVRRVLAMRARPASATVLAAVAGAGLAPAIGAVDGWLMGRFPLPAAVQDTVNRLLGGASLAHRLSLLVCLGVIVPAVQAVFFAGVIYGGVRKRSTALTAVLVTAGCYALFGGDPRAMASRMAVGLALVWMRARSGSALPAVALHVVFASLPIVPVLGGQDPLADIVYARGWVAAGLAGALVALGLSAALLERDAHARASRVDDAEG